MSCSSCSSASPAAQFLKSHAPQEASLQHKDPPKPDDPSKIDLSNAPQAIQAAKAPGTGLVLDVSA
jgi:hypothetical protein